ncbi:hypothetical protein, partial [Thiolapillus sp.]
MVMKPFVDIQGSGWNMTILSGVRGASNVVNAALVKGSVSSVLSHLTVLNNGIAGQAWATGYAGENISTGSDVAPDLDHVTVKVGGDATTSMGIYLKNVADARLERVWIEIDGNNHCRGFMAENSEYGGIVNRLHVHTTNNCDSAVGVFLRSVEINVLNSRIDATASGNLPTYGGCRKSLFPCTYEAPIPSRNRGMGARWILLKRERVTRGIR